MNEAESALREGELTVLGRIRSASNATFLCEADFGGNTVHCVYKPVAGEMPLWDFPDGTLAGREYATYLISAALGWDIVPHTIIREGPAGPGMLQLWVDQDDGTDSGLVDVCPARRVPAGYLAVLEACDFTGAEVTLVHADDHRLRRMAVFDVLVNNADRKGGHILRSAGGGVYGVDHGLCLHVEDKLRTVLWGWSGELVDDETLVAVGRLAGALDGELAERLGDHVTAREVDALRRRVADMLVDPVLPGPDRHRPIPWPAF